MALSNELEKRRAAEEAARKAGRLPPGQSLAAEGKWPVLHEGDVPAFDPESWDFRISGLVAAPRTLAFAELAALPRTRVTTDFHCVTTWSKLGMTWEGVPTRDVLALVAPAPAATAAMVHDGRGYTANLLLDDLLRPGCLFALRVDGADLAPEHGGPLRLVVPHLYAWKSVKWARRIELVSADAPGYWEQRGYHMRGDPFAEERYS